MDSGDDRVKLQDMEQMLNQDFLYFQLYAKAVDLFQDDPSVSASLKKHLLKSIGTSIVGRLLVTLDMNMKLKNGIRFQDSNIPISASLTSSDRTSLAKELTGSVSLKAQAVIESLEEEQLDTFLIRIRDLLDASGLKLQNLEEKIEQSLLQSYLKELVSEVSAETDVVKFLLKIVTLLYIQVYKRALQVPEAAMAAAVSRLKDTLPDSTYKILVEYQKPTAILLALQAAAVDDEYDCSADRILSNIELLESKMPELKALLLSEAN